MPEPIYADTQYGDLQGTAQMDGHEAAPLRELSELTEMPQTFRAVGLSIGTPNLLENVMPFSILAFDSEVVGESDSDMRDYVNEHGSLPLVSFGGVKGTSINKFWSYFKRCSIVTVHKTYADMSDRMQVYSLNEWRDNNPKR